jgi:hypothetical protein
MRTAFQKIKRKIANIFMPEVMVGKHAPPPANRQQRRAFEAVNRKTRNSKRK